MNKNIKMKTEKPDVQSDKRHVCQTCGSSFNRPYRLTQHLLLHQNIKIFQCGEEGCAKSYTSKSHLDRHLYSVHIKPVFDVVHRCPECMKTFANRQNLKRHIKIKHATRTVFKCDVCRADFRKKHLLSSHMYHHTLVKPFSCDLCSKEFITLLEKKKHLKYHKTYNCELCDMAFHQWSKYRKHKKSEHDVKEYNCNDCGRKFKQREHIVRHVKTHMLDKLKSRKYKCWHEDCKRVYSRQSNLKQHIEMKHLRSSHICQICDLKLSCKTTLKSHLKTHCKPEDLVMKHIAVRKHPKTKETGRKDRKDKGSLRNTTALKIAGLFTDFKEIKNNNKLSNGSIQNGNTLNSKEIPEDVEVVMNKEDVRDKNKEGVRASNKEDVRDKTKEDVRARNKDDASVPVPDTIINISLEHIEGTETTNLRETNFQKVFSES